jgi:ABC-2 type transport system permease protein
LSLHRVLRIAQRTCTGLYRDPRALWAILLVPVGTVLLLGYVVRHGSADLTIALVIADDKWSTTTAASNVEEALHSEDILTFRADDQEAAEQAVRDGRAQGFVVVDKALAGDVLSGKEDQVTVGVAGDSLSLSRRTLAAIGGALVTASLRVFQDATGVERDAAEEGVEFDATYIYGGQDYDTLDHLVPALLAFLPFLSMLSVTVVAFTGNRALRTLERLMATALRREEFMLGNMLGYGVVTPIQVGALLLIITLVLKVHFAGNLGAVFILTAASSLGALSLGMLLSAFARSEAQAMQTLPLVLVPQAILCGVIFPLDTLPGALQDVALFLPVTYAVSALRDVMIKGDGLLDPGVAGDLAVLVAFAAFFAVLGARTLRREVG